VVLLVREIFLKKLNVNNLMGNSTVLPTLKRDRGNRVFLWSDFRCQRGHLADVGLGVAGSGFWVVGGESGDE
jgi:hypothetical protein